MNTEKIFNINQTRITIEELLSDTRNKLILDLRNREDFDRMHILEAEWINPDPDTPLAEVIKEQIFADNSQTPLPVYLYCYTGRITDDLAEELREEGIEAYSLKNGFSAYMLYEFRKFSKDQEAMQERCKAIERSIIKKFRKEIWRKFTKAINEYDLIQDGDRIAVCISGGKDSMLMAKLFQELLRHGQQNFEVVYLVMNPGYNEINYETVMNNARLLNVPVTVFTTDIFDTVAGDEIAQGNPCYLCARMRRGHLYAKAQALGCNKIALGHHFDDIIETILMGMLYSGQIQGMMPKLHSTNFPGMELIRPMSYIHEDDIKHWASYNELQFIQCACRFTESCASCGGTEKGSKRAEVKRIIHRLKEDNPYIENNLYRSMDNVHLGTIREYRDKNGIRHNFLDDY